MLYLLAKLDERYKVVRGEFEESVGRAIEGEVGSFGM
jgi:hypothetical protein